VQTPFFLAGSAGAGIVDEGYKASPQEQHGHNQAVGKLIKDLSWTPAF